MLSWIGADRQYETSLAAHRREPPMAAYPASALGLPPPLPPKDTVVGNGKRAAWPPRPPTTFMHRTPADLQPSELPALLAEYRAMAIVLEELYSRHGERDSPASSS